MMDHDDLRLEAELRRLKPQPLRPEAQARMVAALVAPPARRRPVLALAAAAGLVLTAGAAWWAQAPRAVPAPERPLDIEAILAARDRAEERADRRGLDLVLPPAPAWPPGRPQPGS